MIRRFHQPVCCEISIAFPIQMSERSFVFAYINLFQNANCNVWFFHFICTCVLNVGLGMHAYVPISIQNAINFRFEVENSKECEDFIKNYFIFFVFVLHISLFSG